MILSSWTDPLPVVIAPLRKMENKRTRRRRTVVGGRCCCETCGKRMSRRTLISERWCSEACIRVTPPKPKAMTFGLDVLAALQALGEASAKTLGAAISREPSKVRDALVRLQARDLVVRDGETWRAA